MTTIMITMIITVSFEINCFRFKFDKLNATPEGIDIIECYKPTDEEFIKVCINIYTINNVKWIMLSSVLIYSCESHNMYIRIFLLSNATIGRMKARTSQTSNFLIFNLPPLYVMHWWAMKEEINAEKNYTTRWQGLNINFFCIASYFHTCSTKGRILLWNVNK